MRVIVFNRQMAEIYSEESHDIKSIVISIVNENDINADLECNAENKILDILRLRFNDTEDSMGEADAVKICDFVQKYESNKDIDALIVHCGAGQSRSAGVAAAIMKYLTNDDSLIFNNRAYTPNMHCYRLVLNSLMTK